MDNLNIQFHEQSSSNKRKHLINILCQLNRNNPVDYPEDINEICIVNIKEIEDLHKHLEERNSLASSLQKYNSNDDSAVWKFIYLNFHYLFLLEDVSKETSDCLTVQQTKELKNIFRNIVGIGIASNLLPNIPYYMKLPSEDQTVDKPDIFTRYKRLIATTHGMYLCLQCNVLKPLVIPNTKWVLSSFYQIICAPLKKPSKTPNESGFVMTEDIYHSLIDDKKEFETVLKEFSTILHPLLYIRETMLLTGTFSFEHKTVVAPLWFRKGVYSTLGEILEGPKGIENITWALLDAAGLDSSDDSAKSWKTIDVVGKMILDYLKRPDFRENICNQLIDLLKLRDKSGNAIKSFERLFSLSIKLLYQQDESLCREMLIKHLLKPLICFTNEGCNFVDNEDVTETILQTVRLVHSLCFERNFNIPVLPTQVLINNVLNVLFYIYSVSYENDNFRNLNDDLKVILTKTLRKLNSDTRLLIFDNLLFGIPCETSLEIKHNIELIIENNSLIIKINKYSSGIRPLKTAVILKSLLKQDLDMTVIFFNYLLNCLINPEKYFKQNVTNQDLLQLENEFVLDDVLERKFAVYKLLTVLSEQESLQKEISENSGEIIDCIKKLFVKNIENGHHRTDNTDSEQFQAVFVIITLMEVLLEKASKGTLNSFQDLIKPLEAIALESVNKELKEMVTKILLKLKANTKLEKSKSEHKSQTLLDKALEDICDPLLPVRGHGLMTLAKLVEKKGEQVLERKQYILNIFQMNLNNEDSFIYLNAINGLAAMGDIFPDTVLNILTEEYSGFSRKESEDGHEVRIKLGEVLVRITKMLGDTAPKYKSLLLNTFLVGTKDEDYLIRASSLSNLGEVCRVLGYKLGSIVTEVLVCVHGIMTTDKAVEARRAAVTVIRQLFVGLEEEMVVFLKEEILPIYRTLKSIYYNDPDDVMRLQAQVALEELNQNMKNFIFPSPVLHPEKKLVI